MSRSAVPVLRPWRRRRRSHPRRPRTAAHRVARRTPTTEQYGITRGSDHNRSPDATSKRIIPNEPSVTISLPSWVKKMAWLLVSCGLSMRRSSHAGASVDDADRTQLRADGQVSIRGERHCSRRRPQDGVVGTGQPPELTEQLSRRAVANLDVPVRAPADDDELAVVADRHRADEIRDAHRVEAPFAGVHVPDGQPAEHRPGDRATGAPHRSQVAPVLVGDEVVPKGRSPRLRQRVRPTGAAHRWPGRPDGRPRPGRSRPPCRCRQRGRSRCPLIDRIVRTVRTAPGEAVNVPNSADSVAALGASR